MGRALVQALREAGWDVHALTRAGQRSELKTLGATLFEGSPADPNQVAEAAEDCDVLFHAAGVTHPRAPERVLRWVHVAGTENVLNAARHVGVERIVFVSCWSSSLTDGDRMHWDEQRALPKPPLGAHARSKLMAEELALAQSDEQMSVVALRPAQLWGPGDANGLATLWREAEAGGMRTFGGGRNLMPTTHVNNLTRAALLAADAPDAAGQAYYVTDGEFMELREWYGRLGDTLGLGKPRDAGSYRAAMWAARLRQLRGSRSDLWPAEVVERGRSALFDISRATRDLDYRPEHDVDRELGALRAWVDSQGGLAAVAGSARPIPTEGDVDAQAEAAGGD